MRDACVGGRVDGRYGDNALRLRSVHHPRKRGGAECGDCLRHRLFGHGDAELWLRSHISSQIQFTATAATETVSGKILLGGLPLGTDSLSGTATLTSSGSTVNITFTTSPLICSQSTTPPPTCTVTTSNSANFNGTAIAGGSFIWFNANFAATGIPSAGTTVTFTNSTISFTANGVKHTLAVPDSSIHFSSSATCATVSFDTVNKQWDVPVPVSGSDEVFLSGLSFPVPAAGLPGGIQNVTWSGTFGTNTHGLGFRWKWGAAVYSSFSTAYNSLDIKPTHDNACSYNSADHAGTPENTTFQQSVVGGDVKTVGSERALFVDADMLDVLKRWKQTTGFRDETDWMFASPARLGRLPWSHDAVLGCSATCVRGARNGQANHAQHAAQLPVMAGRGGHSNYRPEAAHAA